jgi:hypothetical protein
MAPRLVLLASACAALLACSTDVDLGGRPSGAEGGVSVDGAPNCPGFAAPETPARCMAGTYELAPNGCYGGYYCRLSTRDCQPPSMACGFFRDGG